MGYLNDNESLLGGLRTAAKHLNPGGGFIFDGWFGPAVLSQRPEKRRHEYHNGQDVVVREVTPSLDPIRQIVTVHYNIEVNRNGQIVKQFREEHIMRFMFVQEMALLIETSGLEMVYYCPFLEPAGRLITDTWNVTFVARKES